MATINQIYKEIIDEKNTLSAIKDDLAPTSAQVETLDLLLSELDSRSRVALWRLFAFVVAVSIWLRESFVAKAIAEAEERSSNSDVGTARWLRRKALEFQYSAAAPQSLVFGERDFSIAYPVTDPALRIVTVCSVGAGPSGPYVLCAKGAYPFQRLDDPELAALRDYLSQVQFVHRSIDALSLDADKLYVAGEYFYDPAYASVVGTGVLAALQAHLRDLSSGANFGGYVNLQKLNDVLQAVPGVRDVALTEVSLRAHNAPFAQRTKIYDLASGENIKQAKSAAGHVVLETAPGATLDLNLIGRVQL